MAKGILNALAGNFRPAFALTILLAFSFIARSQTYQPTSHIIANDAIGLQQATPVDSRSMFYDASLFLYRPYQNTSEVLSYLNAAKYRTGNFIIVVDSGGILQPNGTFLNGHNVFYMFADSTGNANLVKLNLFGTNGCSGCLLAANNLSDLQSATTAKTNLALNNVDNTSDLTKWAATATLTNKTISGLSNTFSNIPVSALAQNSIGLTITQNPAANISVTSTPATLGGALIFNVPTASATQRGALQASDFSFFRSKLDTVHLSNDTLYNCANGTCTVIGVVGGGGGGSGTVLSFSSGNLTGFFNTTVTTATTTPNQSFTFVNAGGRTVWGDSASSSGTPFYFVPNSAILADWFGGPLQGALTLTTTGTSGAATLIGNTLNIPNYSAGGGSTNTNIGSGYRWAVPGTNNIKTAFGSLIIIDSTTNTNALTFTADTTSGATKLATQGFVTRSYQPIGNYITATTGDVVATGPGSVPATIQANAVTTTKIINNAVTLAKMATNTVNTLLGYDGSGNAADIALSTSASTGSSSISATVLSIPTYTLQGVITDGATLNTTNVITNTSQIFRWNNAGSGLYEWYGLSQDTTNTVGPYIAGPDSSIRMAPWAKFALKLSPYLPAFTLFPRQGLSPLGTSNDSLQLGGVIGTFFQPDTLFTAGQPFLITGLPHKTYTSTDSAIIEDNTGKLFKTPLLNGTGYVNQSGATSSFISGSATNLIGYNASGSPSAIILGTNLSISGNTLNATGGGSISLPLNQIAWGTGSSITSTPRYLWDSTNHRVVIQNSATYTRAIPPGITNVFMNVTSPYMLMGDSTGNEPSGIIIADPYGGANSTPLKAFMGWGGTAEFHMGMNWYYPGQVHTQFDATQYSNYFSLSPHYFLGQAYGPGTIWNTGKVPWRFDNIESAGNVVGGKLTTNILWLGDYLTTDYNQTTNGYYARLQVSSATLNLTGVPQFQTSDSTKLALNGGATSGFQATMTSTHSNKMFDFVDPTASGLNGNRFDVNNSGSHNLASGIKDGPFDYQGGVAESGAITNAHVVSSFTNVEFYWKTTNSVGGFAERMRLIDTGALLINRTTDNLTGALLQVQGKVSIATIDSTASPVNMLYQDVNGLIKKAAVPSGGGGGGSLPLKQIAFGTGTSITSSSRFILDSTASPWKLALFSTSTQDLTSLNDHSAKIIGNRMYLGDSTQSAPNMIEFGNFSGNLVRMGIGHLGTLELNDFNNMNYRSFIHQEYDTTQKAEWTALSPTGYYFQLVGNGHSNFSSPGVPQDIYNIFGKTLLGVDWVYSGNDPYSARFRVPGEIDVYDPSTTNRDFTAGTGRYMGFTVLSATLDIGGLPAAVWADSVQIAQGGGVNTSYFYAITTTHSHKAMVITDNTASGLTNIRFDETSSGSHNIGANIKNGVFDISGGVGEEGWISTSNAPGSFSNYAKYWKTTLPAGGFAERMRLNETGNLLIGTTTDNSGFLQTAANTTTNASLFINGSSVDISSPTNGMIWYNSTTHSFNIRDNGRNVNVLSSTVASQDENSRTATNASAATQISDTITLPKAIDTFTVWRIKAYFSTNGGSNASSPDAVYFNFKAGSAAATTITGAAWNSSQVGAAGLIDITIDISYNTTDGWIIQSKGNCMNSSFGNNLTPITIYSVLNPGAPSGSFDPTVTTPTIWWLYQQATGTSSKSATFKHMTIEVLHK